MMVTVPATLRVPDVLSAKGLVMLSVTTKWGVGETETGSTGMMLSVTFSSQPLKLLP